MMTDGKNVKIYDYFICYSGKDVGTPGTGGYEFVHTLYTKLTNCNKRVYFAPVMGQGDAYSDPQMLESLIGGLTTSIIVVLSPHFFDEFNDDADPCVIEKEMKVALASAKARGEKSPTGVTDFLKYVHLDGFSWTNSLHYMMDKLFGDEYPFTSYFNISSHILPSPLVSPEDSARKFLKNYLNIDVDREQSVRGYLQDIDLCFHSLIAHAQTFYLQELETYAEKKEGGKYNDINLHNNYVRYVNILDRLGLYAARKEDTSSTYWSVFFTDMKRMPDASDKSRLLRQMLDDDFAAARNEFSPCAVSFGALGLTYWMEGSCSADVCDYTNEYFRETLRGAINFIAYMRNDSGAWPEMKRLRDSTDTVGIDEGLNQTTISISALLKSGFLDPDGKLLGHVGEEVLHNRFVYLLESMTWLVSKATCEGDGGPVYWNIMGDTDNDGSDDDIVQRGSTLMTTMCLDTLIKFFANDYVRRHADEARSVFGEYDQKKFFEGIMRFLANMQSADGGIQPSIDERRTSFSHTAKAVNSLCSFWEFTDDATCQRIAGRIISNGFKYLAALVERDDNAPGKLYDENSQEDYELFNVPATEDYEMSGELMAVTSILRVLDTPDDVFEDMLTSDMVTKYKDPQNKEQLLSKVIEVIDRYRDAHVERFFDITASRALLLRGRRTDEELKYPIYLMYYYRVALQNLSALLARFYSGAEGGEPAEAQDEEYPLKERKSA